MKKSLLILAVLLALVLTGCKSASSDPKKAMCDSLDTLNQAVQSAKALSASTNIDQVKKSGQDLENAWVDVQKTTKKMKEPQLTNIRDSYREIVKSLRTVTDTATLQTAVSAIQTSAPKFDTAYSTINTTSCANK